MTQSELGEIPDSWKVLPAKEILQRHTAPKTYRKEGAFDVGEVPVYEQGQSILMGYHDESPCFESDIEHPKFIFGDHTCVTKLIVRPFSISPNVITLSGNGFDTIWVYYATHKLQKFLEYRRHWMELADKKLVVPTECKDSEFSAIVKPLVSKISQNEIQIQNLTLLRDAVLPKLMKGEIRVPIES